jgi:hypothetical protein
MTDRDVLNDEVAEYEHRARPTYEVEPTRHVKTGSVEMEVCTADNADYWSVYRRDGFTHLAEWVADCVDEGTALFLAIHLRNS